MEKFLNKVTHFFELLTPPLIILSLIAAVFYGYIGEYPKACYNLLWACSLELTQIKSRLGYFEDN